MEFHGLRRRQGQRVLLGYHYRWWLRNAAASYETDRRLEGTVQADDFYHTAGQKGQTRQAGLQRPWVVDRVGAARSVSPAAACQVAA